MATYKSYTAKHEGKHISMTVTGRDIRIHDSRDLIKGDEFSYPEGSFVLLIVAGPDKPGAD